MEILFVILIIVFAVCLAKVTTKKPVETVVAGEFGKSEPEPTKKEKRKWFTSEDKSSMLKYSILFVVFSSCVRFIILTAIPTTFLVKAEIGNSSHRDFKVRHDWSQSHIKLDHDWSSYNTLRVEQKGR